MLALTGLISLIAAGYAAAHILDFDPQEDRIELLYDPTTNPDPSLELREIDGRTDVYLDGISPYR
ncbi:MAG: hypothetical protein ACPGDA_00875 [Paracoccaceae bacterium]